MRDSRRFLNKEKFLTSAVENALYRPGKYGIMTLSFFETDLHCWKSFFCGL